MYNVFEYVRQEFRTRCDLPNELLKLIDEYLKKTIAFPRLCPWSKIYSVYFEMILFFTLFFVPIGILSDLKFELIYRVLLYNLFVLPTSVRII